MAESFTLNEVAPGIHAAIAHSISGPAVANATIIDLGDKTIVVDTFMTIHAADELASAAENVTGRRAFAVVTSHFHIDHVGGNAAFADTPMIATRRTLDLIAADSPADRDAYADQAEAMLRSARGALEAAEDAEAEASARGLLAMAEAMRQTQDRYSLVLPDLLFDGRLTIEGERSIDIVAAGMGHTPSDIYVHVPDAEVVVAGDLVWNRIHPKTNDGFPPEWAVAVDGIASLKPSIVVPGHGAVGDLETVETMAAYLRSLDGLVQEARDGALDPAAALAPPGSDGWQGIDRMRRGLASIAAR